MKNALARAHPSTPEIASVEGRVLIKFGIETEKEIGRSNHIARLKVERASFLLWRRSILLKKLSDIDNEIASMFQGEL